LNEESVPDVQRITMPIRVRRVEEADVVSMAAIRAQEWETEAFWKARIERYLRGEHSPQKALSARAAFVAVDNGAALGFVSGHRTSRYGCDGELQWINVAREYRGRGIAGTLLETIAHWFVQQQASRVCVNVAPNNTAACGLYKKYGAEPLNEHWLVWSDIGVIIGKTRSVRPGESRLAS
jgi:ribosomal protein S18 acetylase RimI-like enzyme